MSNLTEKQQRFADEYIRTGNITQSYMVAYPHIKKENSAATSGSRMLSNVKVKDYVDKRLEELKKESIAEQDEILQFLSAVIRGETSGKQKLGIGQGAEKIVNMQPTLQEQIKAAEQLGKRYGMWKDKQEIEHKLPTFVDDINE